MVAFSPVFIALPPERPAAAKAASGTALNAETGEIVAGAVPPAGKIAAIICIIVCFVIAFTNKRSEAK